MSRRLNDYKDIIDLKRPASKYSRMSMHDRAAQFAPFSALDGYEDEIDEEARFTDNFNILDEESVMIINSKLAFLSDKLKSHPEVTIVYFLKDDKKDGGKYMMVKDIVKKIDDFKKTVVLNSNLEIPFIFIYDIDGDVFKGNF